MLEYNESYSKKTLPYQYKNSIVQAKMLLFKLKHHNEPSSISCQHMCNSRLLRFYFEHKSNK